MADEKKVEDVMASVDAVIKRFMDGEITAEELREQAGARITGMDLDGMDELIARHAVRMLDTYWLECKTRGLSEAWMRERIEEVHATMTLTQIQKVNRLLIKRTNLKLALDGRPGEIDPRIMEACERCGIDPHTGERATPMPGVPTLREIADSPVMEVLERAVDDIEKMKGDLESGRIGKGEYDDRMERMAKMFDAQQQRMIGVILADRTLYSGFECLKIGAIDMGEYNEIMRSITTALDREQLDEVTRQLLLRCTRAAGGPPPADVQEAIRQLGLDPFTGERLSEPNPSAN